MGSNKVQLSDKIMSKQQRRTMSYLIVYREASGLVTVKQMLMDFL